MITSAGGVISVAHEDEIHVLLLRYPNGRLAFPKGRVDEGETLEEAAAREVEEETGVVAPKVLQKLGEVVYRSENVAQSMHEKIMHIFLMTTEQATNKREENAGWYPLSKAAEEMQLAGERKLLSKNADVIASHVSAPLLFQSFPTL